MKKTSKTYVIVFCKMQKQKRCFHFSYSSEACIYVGSTRYPFFYLISCTVTTFFKVNLSVSHTITTLPLFLTLRPTQVTISNLNYKLQVISSVPLYNVVQFQLNWLTTLQKLCRRLYLQYFVLFNDNIAFQRLPHNPKHSWTLFTLL